jgi:alpha-D-xyloside xylohydrolase
MPARPRGRTPTTELYIRWAQFGTFSPIMQYHGQTPREPWAFGPEAEQAFKFLARLRMNLRPMLKALGDEAAKTGLPIMRPMILEFPDDARFLNEDTQYMLGPDLLVAPVIEQGAKRRTVKFPKGTWRHLLERTEFEGPSEADVPVDLMTPAVFVRDGASLQVELEKDAKLGTWRKGAPARTLTFGP